MSVVPTIKGERVFRVWPDVPDGAWDAIVIGSGMGGMSCAAALAQTGRRVLVLEQHYLPGGYTHMFARKGWAWDVGVHAVGEMRPDDSMRKLLDWLSDGHVEMAPLGNPYDRFWFPDGFRMTFPDDPEDLEASLIATFPEQADRIRAYLRLVAKVARYSRMFFFTRSLPRTLDRILTWMQHRFSRDWWRLTTAEVLDEFAIEGRLRNVLAAQWGYVGEVPGAASFAAQALIHNHYKHGAWYPVGGARVIAEGLLATVRKAGGEAVVSATVDQVLVEGNRAVGVRLADGSELRSPRVISATGVRTTVQRLVPPSLRDSAWARDLLSLTDSPSYICLNLGFEGDIGATEASAANLWLYDTWLENEREWDPTQNETPQILYVSFPSLKDPSHDPGPRQRNTGECITFVPWDLFSTWSDSTHGDRDERYAALKAELTERVLAALRRKIPNVMQHLVFSELSTPLSAAHFVHASQGAIYGLAAVPSRYRCAALRTRTPIKGLLMTGADVTSFGVVGAMSSGVLTAANIAPRLYRRLL